MTDKAEQGSALATTHLAITFHHLEGPAFQYLSKMERFGKGKQKTL